MVVSGFKSKMADSSSKFKMATCPGSTRSLLLTTLLLLTLTGKINNKWITFSFKFDKLDMMDMMIVKIHKVDNRIKCKHYEISISNNKKTFN